MARFGQGLFSGSGGTGLNLMNAQLAEVGERLGSAVPTARRVMQKRQDETQFRQLMSQAQRALTSKDSSALATIAANLSQMGKQEQAMALSQAAQKISGEAEASAKSRGVQGGLAYFTQAAARGVPFEQLQEGVKSVISQGGTAEDAFAAYQRGVPESEDLSDRYRTVGNRVFDNTTGEFVSVEEASEDLSLSALEKIATPDSIIEFVKTKDKSALKPIADEKEEEGVLVSALSTADNTLKTINEAAGLAEEILPLVYDISKYAPMSDGRALKGKIDTLQANLSFDRLQKMRDESKTGGALGNVSNIELNLLGSTVASLDPASKDFAKQLEKVQQHYETFKASLLGQKPPSDRYVEDNGRIYYEDDNGNFVDLGVMK